MEELIRNGSLEDITPDIFNGSIIRRNSIIDLLCKYSRLDVLKWIYEKEGAGIIGGTENPWNFVASLSAIYYGRINILKWLLSVSFTTRCYNLWAAENGQLEILEWLEAIYPCRHEDLYAHATSGGRLEVIKWLLEKGYSHDWRVCAEAARGGHFELLKWLVENKFTISSHIIECASLEGRYDILKWCRKMDFPWDITTTCNIAKRGDLDMLKWVRDPNEQGGVENICPIDPSAFEAAAYGGHIEVLRWLRANGHYSNHSYRTAILVSISTSNFKLLMWIMDPIEQGGIENVPYIDDTLCYDATLFDNLDILEYLHIKRNTINWECKEGQCKVCNAKRDIIYNCEEDNYTSWLSYRMLKDI